MWKLEGSLFHPFYFSSSSNTEFTELDNFILGTSQNWEFAGYFITARCACSVIVKPKTEAMPTNTPLTNFVSYVTVSINLLSGCQYKLLFCWFLVPILLKGKATINTRETDLSDFLCSDRSTMRSNTMTRRSGLFRIPPAVIYSKNK